MNLERKQQGRALFRLGSQYVRAKGYDEAQASFELGLALEPDSAAGCFELANLLHSLGKQTEAAERYTRAVELNPRFAEAWYNLGVVRMMGREFESAKTAYRRALEANPDYAEAHNNLAILLQTERRVDLAAEHYRTAARLKPRFAEALYNLAVLLDELGRLEESRTAYEALLKQDPNHVDARNNLANVLLELGHPAAARDAHRAVLALDPNHPLAHWNLGIVELQLGAWREGWKNYEWRFRQRGARPEPRDRPRWDGRRLHGERVLLMAEQGLGDMIQFLRFVPLAAGRGAQVWVECDAALKGLASRMPEVRGTIVKGDAPPEHEFWAPLMSLPGILGIELNNLPARVPYLCADPDRLIHWGRRLEGRQMKVGITWSGSPQFKANAKRRLEDGDVRRIASLTADRGRIRFYSLQKGVPQVEGAGLMELGDDGSTLEDAAAIVSNLDLVISADTSIAHLAGALAKPVWTMLAHAADWRWMTGRRDSPWYPTMRLFRQKRRGDWSAVVESIRAELAAEIAGPHSMNC